MIDYNKRLVEVDEILNYLTPSDYAKIPKEIIDLIKQNKDTEYTWKYDSTKELKDQDVSNDTIAILSYINMEYLLNKEQKEYMEKVHKLNDKKEREKSINTNIQKVPETSNYDNIFKKSDSNRSQSVPQINNSRVNGSTPQVNSSTPHNSSSEKESNIVVYKESLFKRLLEKVIKFFRK